MYNCTPILIQDEYHNLLPKQIQFLNRGPCYVAPCQMHCISNELLANDEAIVEHQYAGLKNQLAYVFSHFLIDLSCRMNFERQLHELFRECFTKTIPEPLKARAIRERYLIHSIQYELRQRNLILRRTADDQNTFYLGALDEFESICTQFMEQTQCYVATGTIDEKNTEKVHLNDISEMIDAQLFLLFDTQIHANERIDQFLTKTQSKLKLPRLYFLPDKNSDVRLVVQPRFTSYRNAPIQRIAHYLDRKIRPLFESVSRTTLVRNTLDFQERFINFRVQEHQRHKETLIGSLKIHDLYAHISHDELLEALSTLLSSSLVVDQCKSKDYSLIMDLTAIVLERNYFVYRNEIYRFDVGSPLNLPLTKLLCNIYLHFWQKPLWRAARLKNVFYARYNNEAFLTWYDSLADLQKMFDELQETLPTNVELITSIASFGNFMQCRIEVDNGRLTTEIYRDANMQPFVLPFFPGYSRIIYRKWYRFMMTRALLINYNLEPFQDERRYIEATLLANGFSLDLVEYLWRQFVERCGFSASSVPFLNSYIIYTMHTNLHREMITLNAPNAPECETHLLIQEGKFINLSYLYDWGERIRFNSKFRELWETILNADSYFKSFCLRPRISAKHRYLSNAVLTFPRIHMKPIQ